MVRTGSVEEINKAENALIFIPDISGFTGLMNNTRLSESRKIIHDLMEVIIDSVTLNLKIGDIEGDAVLFYHTGPAPSVKDITCQAQKTFYDFINVLKEKEKNPNFPPGARNLTLKFIVHYGEIITTSIKGIIKLMGSDVVLAHRILKNNIKSREYILLTEQYLETQEEKELKDAFLFSELRNGRKKYDHLGYINYKYCTLTPMRKSLDKKFTTCY
ncbi:DUF2652 domain-containing protein [Cytophagaceae bacterium ABcell3]|nr:DUF2652 domain-containing protein [Cytophagaceae bacterium ABcell3]